MTSCGSCKVEVGTADVLDHIESFHVGPQPLESIKLRCSECEFRVTAARIPDIIAHCTVNKHRVEGISVDWTDYTVLEEVRILNIIAHGMYFADNQVPDEVLEEISKRERNRPTKRKRESKDVRIKKERTDDEECSKTQELSLLCENTNERLEAFVKNEKGAVEIDHSRNYYECNKCSYRLDRKFFPHFNIFALTHTFAHVSDPNLYPFFCEKCGYQGVLKAHPKGNKCKHPVQTSISNEKGLKILKHMGVIFPQFDWNQRIDWTNLVQELEYL